MGFLAVKVVQVLTACLLVCVDYNLGQGSPNDMSLPQCITNEECHEHKACMELSCKDPCPGLCQGNSSCQVRAHVPYCACKPGFSGDPFVGCTQQSNCQNGGTSSGQKRYVVERLVKVNWYAALVYCHSRGGRLATIESNEDNEKLNEEIQRANIRNDRFWTSGTDYPHGHWMWMSSGKSFPDFSNWDVGEPNGGDEHCLELLEKDLKGHKWNDRHCMNRIIPICEYFG